ncbi:MAG TPA: hypothetical protein VF743_01005 [Acidimicrobiales bacterium]
MEPGDSRRPADAGAGARDGVAGGAGADVPVDEVRVVFGAAADRGWTAVPLAHEAVASATTGLWRVRCGGRSAVLKLLALRPGGHERWRAGAAVDHWYHWRREAEAYRSGLLDSLGGGLRAPACHLVADRPDGSVALWLEDVAGAPAPTWPLDRYRTAARHLGAAQGAFAAGRPLPDDPWLSRGWLRAYLRQRDHDLALLGDAAAWRHPEVARWLPGVDPAEVAAVRADQGRFLDALEAVPRTVAHLDLHPANLFADGAGATVTVDWAFVGIAALGEDAGNLVPDAVLDFHVPAASLGDLHEAVAAGYTDGLRAAGWDGPPALVRLAMAAVVAAKYGWIAGSLLRVVTEDRPQLNRRPTGDALAWWAPTVGYVVERAAEARRLAAALGP